MTLSPTAVSGQSKNPYSDGELSSLSHVWGNTVVVGVGLRVGVTDDGFGVKAEVEVGVITTVDDDCAAWPTQLFHVVIIYR